MAASFGEQLREAREARGITLREISDHTRIPLRYLEAIENDDYKPLPGGIFNRSFIKKYANYIGFDENEALSGYARTARDQGSAADEVSTTPHLSNVYTDSGSNRSPLITLLLMAVILGVLVLGVYAGLHWYQRRSEGTAAVGPEQSTQSSQTQPVARSNTNTAAPAPSPVAPAPVSKDFKVQVKAVGLPVWVELTPDGGKPSSATLKPGDTREVTPDQKVTIKLAKINTNALQVNINGREAKLPYDTKGNSAEFTLTRDGYTQFLQQ